MLDRKAWLERGAARLVARIGDRGMVLSHKAAATILEERLATSASQLGVSEQHARHLLDDAVIDALAERLVATFLDEEPGENVYTLPRTARISVASLGRLISALAETLLIVQTRNDPEGAARQRETTQLLSVAGMVQADHVQGPVAAPPALLMRIARLLTTAADQTDNEELSQALRRDAIRARSASSVG